MSIQYEVFSNPRLLRIPTKRAAWSDRTALLMAAMSKLAYHKFEVDAENNAMPQRDLDDVLERLLAPDNEAEKNLSAHSDEKDRPPALPEGAVTLRDDLAKGGFELAGLFSDKGTDTQAFLAISKPVASSTNSNGYGAGSGSSSTVRPSVEEDVAVLSFRGTENMKDWLTNIKFLQAEARGTDVHWGFQRAFDAIKTSVQAKVTPLVNEGRTLYLTGHSLGGALALIATREMVSDSHGACYTYGSPRVGRFGFARDIKTPIYRVVNSNDLVPRIPPAYIPSILQFLLRVLNVPAFGLLNSLIGKITKYVHYGDMRFLRRTKSPTYDDLQVLSNPSVIYRFFWYWPALIANWKSPVKNHAIDVYCAKLDAYAERRNPPS